MSEPPAAPHAALAEAWAKLPWAEARESALLAAFALVGTAQRASGVVTLATPAAPAAAPEELPLASAAAARLLPRLLEAEQHALLGEWIELCAARRRLVPPVLLPHLFAAAPNGSRAQVTAVAGHRGRWLARQNPEWSWVLGHSIETDPEQWDTGTADERLAALRTLRRTDPAAARERLARDWKNEEPDFRERALAELADGLGAADEPWLAGLLTDRRRGVRDLAQRFLARLPGSAFARRNVARAQTLLRCPRGLLGAGKLEFTPPDAFAAEWKADGFEVKPPAGTGEKAWWSRQILALVPFAHWRDAFGADTAALLELAGETEWPDLLRDSWLDSLQVAPDAELAVALFELHAAPPARTAFAREGFDRLTALLEACPADRRWPLVAQLDAPYHQWSLLRFLVAPGDDRSTRVLLHKLAPSLRDGTVPGGSPQAVLAARLFPVALRDEAARLLEREAGLTKPAEAFLQALDLRAALHAAFSPNA